MGLQFLSASIQYIDVGSGASLDLTSAFTIGTRMYLTSNYGAGDCIHIFDKPFTSHSNPYYSYLIRVDNTSTVWLQCSIGSSWKYKSTSLNGFTNSAWHTVYVTFDSSNIRFYQDGSKLGGDVALSGALDAFSSTNGYIGTDKNGGQYSNDVYLTDVRVYNRKLSDTEIKIIDTAWGNDNIVNGLVGRWLMDEKPTGQIASGAGTVIDISSNANHGTGSGNPVYKPAPMTLI